MSTVTRNSFKFYAAEMGRALRYSLSLNRVEIFRQNFLLQNQTYENENFPFPSISLRFEEEQGQEFYKHGAAFAATFIGMKATSSLRSDEKNSATISTELPDQADTPQINTKLYQDPIEELQLTQKESRLCEAPVTVGKTTLPMISNDQKSLIMHTLFYLPGMRKKVLDLIGIIVQASFSSLRWLYQNLNRLLLNSKDEGFIQWGPKEQELLNCCQQRINNKSFLPNILLHGGDLNRQKITAERMAKNLEIKFNHFDGRQLLQNKEDYQKFSELIRRLNTVRSAPEMIFVSNADEICQSKTGVTCLILTQTGSPRKEYLFWLGVTSLDHFQVPDLKSRYHPSRQLKV